MNKDTAEYEKDLNELKEQILKEGNTLLTKRDLLERFCKIDKDYNGDPWNLLQILANINILIGEEPCEDCVSRAEAQTEIEMNASRYIISKERGGMGQVEWSDQFIKVSDAVDIIRHLSPVTPKPKTGHWFYDKSTENWRCSECNETPKTMGYCGPANFMAKHFKFCNHCGVRMVDPQESEG